MLPAALARLARAAALAVAVALASAPAGPEAAAADAAKRVLVFGDSNSWGWVPKAEGLPSERYPADVRWPGVMQAALGPEVEIVVDALSGRTTDVADPSFPQLTGAGLDGSASLPAVIAAHLPLDLVVIMLGTNDTKAQFARTPFRIALGAGRLVDTVQGSANMFGGGWYGYPAPKVLLVAPPPLGPQTVFAEAFEGGVERSKGLARAYANVAEAAGVGFFDAGSVVATDGADGVHFSAATMKTLGEAMAAEVRKALP